MKSFHGNQIIKCSKCDFRSKSERQAEEHIQTKHNGVKYTCNQCDYESEILKELKGHQDEKKTQGDEVSMPLMQIQGYSAKQS